MHLIAVDMGVPSHIIHTKYGPYSKWFERAYKTIDPEIMVDGFGAGEVDLEDLLECDGVILSGAEENVGDEFDWLPDFDEKLRSLINYKQPLLGVCFSHQYLSDHFGGTVERREQSEQHGNYVISLNDAGRSDPLFDDVPKTCYVLQTHFETVTEPGQGCVVLASDDDVPVQAFRHGDSVWGVQFHPELTRGMVMSIIDELDLDEEEREKLKFEANNAHDGLKILDNFAAICRQRSREASVS